MLARCARLFPRVFRHGKGALPRGGARRLLDGGRGWRWRRLRPDRRTPRCIHEGCEPHARPPDRRHRLPTACHDRPRRPNPHRRRTRSLLLGARRLASAGARAPAGRQRPLRRSLGRVARRNAPGTKRLQGRDLPDRGAGIRPVRKAEHARPHAVRRARASIAHGQGHAGPERRGRLVRRKPWQSAGDDERRGADALGHPDEVRPLPRSSDRSLDPAGVSRALRVFRRYAVGRRLEDRPSSRSRRGRPADGVAAAGTVYLRFTACG